MGLVGGRAQRICPLLCGDLPMGRKGRGKIGGANAKFLADSGKLKELQKAFERGGRGRKRSTIIEKRHSHVCVEKTRCLAAS